MPKPRYSELEFKNAIVSSNNIRQVLLKLNMSADGGAYKVIHRAIKRHNIDASHLLKKSFKHNQFVIDEIKLKEYVKSSYSIADVIKKFGKSPLNGSFNIKIKRKIKEFKLDTSHFTGQGWSAGKKIGYQKPITEYLVNKDSGYGSHKLKLRLIEEKVFEHKCYICNITEWCGQPTPIQLDHINGNHYDNRLENLRIVCPNCHAQTDTYCGRNKK